MAAPPGYHGNNKLRGVPPHQLQLYFVLWVLKLHGKHHLHKHQHLALSLCLHADIGHFSAVGYHGNDKHDFSRGHSCRPQLNISISISWNCFFSSSLWAATLSEIQQGQLTYLFRGIIISTVVRWFHAAQGASVVYFAEKLEVCNLSPAAPHLTDVFCSITPRYIYNALLFLWKNFWWVV